MAEQEEETTETYDWNGGIDWEDADDVYIDDADELEVDENEFDYLVYDYVQALTEDVEDTGEDQELCAACDVLATQARSFAEAKDIVRRMRVSRGYYPIARMPTVERPFQPDGKNRKGKGKGKKKGPGGGRVTQKSTARITEAGGKKTKSPLMLPGLDRMDADELDQLAEQLDELS